MQRKTVFEVDNAEMLEKLLDNPEQLTDEELQGFCRMQQKLAQDTVPTPPQREWMENVFSRNRLDQQERPMEKSISASAAIASRKAVVEQMAVGELWWQKPENRPLKPPCKFGPGDTARPNI